MGARLGGSDPDPQWWLAVALLAIFTIVVWAVYLRA